MTKDKENYKYCDSYDERKEIVGWFTPSKPITNTVGRCRGTKECDICSCEGNQFKCDFYEYVREGAKNNEVKEPTPILNYTYIFTDNNGVIYKIRAKSKKDAVGIFNKKYGIPFWFIRKYFTIKKEK